MSDEFNYPEYVLAQMSRMRQEDEDCLPEHKREGYAERMAEIADMKRKEARESGDG